MAGAIKIPGPAEITGGISRPSLSTATAPESSVVQVAPASKLGSQVSALGESLQRIGAQQDAEAERLRQREKLRTDNASVLNQKNELLKDYNVFLNQQKQDHAGLDAQSVPQNATDWFKVNKNIYSDRLHNNEQKQAWDALYGSISTGGIIDAGNYSAGERKKGINQTYKDIHSRTSLDIVRAANDLNPEKAEQIIFDAAMEKYVLVGDKVSVEVANIENNNLRKLFVTNAVAKDPTVAEDLAKYYDGVLDADFLAKIEKGAGPAASEQKVDGAVNWAIAKNPGNLNAAKNDIFKNRTQLELSIKEANLAQDFLYEQYTRQQAQQNKIDIENNKALNEDIGINDAQTWSDFYLPEGDPQRLDILNLEARRKARTISPETYRAVRGKFDTRDEPENDALTIGTIIDDIAVGNDVSAQLDIALGNGNITSEKYLSLKEKSSDREYKRGAAYIRNALKPSALDKFNVNANLRYLDAIDLMDTFINDPLNPMLPTDAAKSSVEAFLGDNVRKIGGLRVPKYLEGSKSNRADVELSRKRLAAAYYAGKISLDVLNSEGKNIDNILSIISENERILADKLANNK